MLVISLILIVRSIKIVYHECMGNKNLRYTDLTVWEWEKQEQESLQLQAVDHNYHGSSMNSNSSIGINYNFGTIGNCNIGDITPPNTPTVGTNGVGNTRTSTNISSPFSTAFPMQIITHDANNINSNNNGSDGIIPLKPMFGYNYNGSDFMTNENNNTMFFNTTANAANGSDAVGVADTGPLLSFESSFRTLEGNLMQNKHNYKVKDGKNNDNQHAAGNYSCNVKNLNTTARPLNTSFTNNNTNVCLQSQVQWNVKDNINKSMNNIGDQDEWKNAYGTQNNNCLAMVPHEESKFKLDKSTITVPMSQTTITPMVSESQTENTKYNVSKKRLIDLRDEINEMIENFVHDCGGDDIDVIVEEILNNYKKNVNFSKKDNCLLRIIVIKLVIVKAFRNGETTLFKISQVW